MSKKNKGKNEIKQSKRIWRMLTVLAVLVITGGIVLCVFLFTNGKDPQIAGTAWTSTSAYTASGDEADLAEIYNTRYSAYQGTLTFKEDGTFEMWLTPGDPEDGTHKGTYTWENGVLQVQFSGGDTEEFTVKYTDESKGQIAYIQVPYQEYTVYFSPEN